MFKNYLKIAWRNLLKNKTFSLINILGLAIGMASAALIMLWVQNELSYDRFHEKRDRLYEVYNREIFSGKLWCWNTTPKILGKTLRGAYPQIEDAARVSNANFLFTIGDNKLKSDGAFTDPGFLTMFTFPLLKGNPKTALNSVYSIVITQKMSKKLFGDADAMGKVVRIDSNANFTVTGVMKDLPNNTAFSFDYLLPWSYMTKIGWDDSFWGNNSVQTYVLLKPGVTLAQANAVIKNVTIEHSGHKQEAELFLHPASKWRLYSEFKDGKNTGGFISSVRLFAIVALFILLIACINFMNLSTARSEKRAKEVGIRKVAGAQKQSLIGQFLGESIMLAVFAGLVALVIVYVSLPSFNVLMAKQLYLPFESIYFWMIFIGFILFTGVMAGSYPAFYLSSFKPVKVLKGTFKAANALVTPRKVLVVTQFTFAIVLIICTIVVKRQIQYGQERETGYKRDNLVYTPMEGEIAKHYQAIRNELLSSGAAVGVTKTSSPVTQGWSDSWGYTWAGSKPSDEKLDFDVFNSDGDFVRTMGLKLVAGRDIDAKTYPTDSTAMIINEASAKAMGFKDPIGQQVRQSKDRVYHIVGVVKDFILRSPYQPVKPMLIQGPVSWFNVVHYKLNPAHSTAENLRLAEQVFKKYNPDYPFEYKFVDEEYAAKFANEQRIGKLASLFAGLTIFISCLGLFGLAAYMAQNRIKEIGIRKVLGASVANITTLLSTEFLKLVVLAFVIASPIAWYSMTQWLAGYSYRIDMGIWIFVMAAFFSVAIALVTVSFQSIKAALSSPVKSLRSE